MNEKKAASGSLFSFISNKNHQLMIFHFFKAIIQ